jgi:hypothetical protein
MSGYEQNSVKRMMNQVKDINNASKDHWNPSFERNRPEDVLKTKEEC